MAAPQRASTSKGDAPQNMHNRFIEYHQSIEEREQPPKPKDIDMHVKKRITRKYTEKGNE